MGKLYTPNITSGLGFSYDFTLNQPFDTREVVSTFNDLITLNTWKKGDDYVHYKGMKVSCADTGKIYVYKGATGDTTEVTKVSNWIAQGADVVDNLTTDNAAKALSAAQGKELKKSIDTLSTNLEAAKTNLSTQISTSADNITTAYIKAIKDLTANMEVGTDEDDNPNKFTIANAIKYAVGVALNDTY